MTRGTKRERERDSLFVGCWLWAIYLNEGGNWAVKQGRRDPDQELENELGFLVFGHFGLAPMAEVVDIGLLVVGERG